MLKEKRIAKEKLMCEISTFISVCWKLGLAGLVQQIVKLGSPYKIKDWVTSKN